MGSELLGEDSSSQESTGVGATEKQPTLSYTGIIYQCLPHYLLMGMSADEFWNCDPRVYQAYQEKDRLCNERLNEQMWLQGIYMRDAIASVLLGEEAPYPQAPFDLGYRTEEPQEMTDEAIQKTPQFIAVMDWAMRVNKQMQGENNGR